MKEIIETELTVQGQNKNYLQPFLHRPRIVPNLTNPLERDVIKQSPLELSSIVVSSSSHAAHRIWFSDSIFAW